MHSNWTRAIDSALGNTQQRFHSRETQKRITLHKDNKHVYISMEMPACDHIPYLFCLQATHYFYLQLLVDFLKDLVCFDIDECEVRRIRSVPGNNTVPLITSPKMQPTDHMSTKVTQVYTRALPTCIQCLLKTSISNLFPVFMWFRQLLLQG